MKNENAQLEKRATKKASPGETEKIMGVCLGASTVSIVHIERNGNEKPKIIANSVHPHEGDPRRTLLSALERYDVGSFNKIAATGRKFRNFVNLSSIPEPEAVEYAYGHVKPPDMDCPAVVSAGGETFMIYALDRKGRISNVLTGNKCASGTGEFFLQQLRRMNVSLDEAAQWAASEDPHHVSGRCSVFCKSDCTHATNKGVPKSKVTAGLCRMMADKILELLKKVDRKNIMVTGGTAQNRMMIEYLRKAIPGLIVPKEAPCFEALGAALWATKHETMPFPKITPEDSGALFRDEAAAFDSLPPLTDFAHMVEFKTIQKDAASPGDDCVLGLDVGSTTTKAVLLRKKDNAMLASVYLRTNGDPVGASRNCYSAIFDQIRETTDPKEVTISGLGVTGSGRQIAGLHALTDGVINEIIAHATAAVYFDRRVDTIFEIGGQDAKYTYVTNGVSSDYAMNEACSAGTGSFLEESAYETLGVNMEEIADVALRGKKPPNFNDQCAAFISSDIKNAIHEGVGHEDIVAGLVYSICMNYSNRVKGNRPVGEKVFMQGGVCYNKAVPLAMASLVGKPIVVPPEPGLMGAFGVALEVKNRVELGLMKEDRFDLETLVNREVVYGKSFICGGGKEKCDRRCEIAMIELEGKKHPFGGACNRYYNLRHNVNFDVENLDLVRVRQHLIFDKYGASIPAGTTKRGTVGINRSFLTNTYYPLYSAFFTELGFEPILPDIPARKGIDERNAAFCYPVELAHGFFYDLINRDDPPDFVFLPHFKAVPVQNGQNSSQVCPLVQGETYYLKTTFRKKLGELEQNGMKILTPLLDLTKGLELAEKPLVETARLMGVKKKDAKAAFAKALENQVACITEMKAIGKKVLAALEQDPEKFAVVIFGRPYNGFVEEAHMGIPHKFASRGTLALPLDFLPLEDEEAKRHMFWGMGQLILKAARFVKRHPQLFGAYVTNFSCGPDSFVIGYFRDIMAQKPSLTLELDSHTADAGLETRIEAFLDIVKSYRDLLAKKQIAEKQKTFAPARTAMRNGKPVVIRSSGEVLAFSDPRVKFVIPSMGRFATEAFASAFRAVGVNAVPHPPADEEILKLGRANTSCKECLPLILTTGMLLNYTGNKQVQDDVVVYFMATASGPCRFGQYYVFMEDLIKKNEIPDVALFSLSSENGYAGMGNAIHKLVWWGIMISDIIEDIRSMLLTNARDTETAMRVFEREWGMIRKAIETGHYPLIERQLEETAENLRLIPLKFDPKDVPTVSIVGEIFVRRDSLSRRYLTETLAEKGFAAVCSPISEWLLYSDYLVGANLAERPSLLERLSLKLKQRYTTKSERRIKSILAKSGLIHPEPIRVESIIGKAEPFISQNLTGEAVLTVGCSISEVASSSCGVIAIGPFGCMPNRLSESILNETMNHQVKLSTDPYNEQLKKILTDIDELPFLAIESDGSPFPQVINAKIESFCLRAERLHERMRDARNGN